MSRITVDPDRLLELVKELTRLHGRLDLGQANYLRDAMNAAVTGYAPLTKGLDDYETHWDFGRDRIMTSLAQVIDYLQHVAVTYAETEVQLATEVSAIASEVATGTSEGSA